MVKEENFLLATVFICLLCSFLFLTEFIFAETEVHLFLTGSRLPVEPAKLTRQVTVLTSKEIEKMPVKSIPELLATLLPLDIQGRGSPAVQADVGMRGSTFEQVVVLIDGVKVNDPQTGHHSLDLPLGLNDIERVEILHGQSSSLYGSNGSGGVVSIITKKPGKKKTDVSLSYGDYHSWSGGIGLGGEKISFHIEGRKSDGYPVPEKYLKSTEKYSYDYDSLSGFARWENGQGKDYRWDITLGLASKNFGAYDFYTPMAGYPSREETDSVFGKIEFLRKMGTSSLKSAIFSRVHKDKFILDSTGRRTTYINEHTNSTLGVILQVETRFLKQDFVIGFEPVREEISSVGTKGGLGKHERTKIALYEETIFSKKNISLNPSLRSEFNSFTTNWEHAPNLGLSWDFFPGWKLRSSLGRTYRIPSFTELYYEDLVNKGDASLKIESSWSSELGISRVAFSPDKFDERNFQLDTSFFWREEKDVIDWVQVSVNPRKFQVTNIGRLKKYGLDFGLRWRTQVLDTSINYVHTQTANQGVPSISKYALRSPLDQISLWINYQLPWEIQQSWSGVYKKRKNEKGYFNLCGKMGKKIKNIELILEGTNLLNESYEEVLGVPQPGRWFWAGLKIQN